jgi:cholesterol oxidase
MNREYDAVIIGSGFGGSVMALRLSEKGKKVCFLERGRQWTSYNFPRRLPEFLLSTRIMKLDNIPLTEKDFPFLEKEELQDIYLAKGDGLFEFKLSSTGMHAVVANAVGGGSLIYSCVLMETPPVVFSKGWPDINWPAELDYQSVRNELGVAKAVLPDGSKVPKSCFFEKAWEKAGRRGRWELPDLAHQPLDYLVKKAVEKGAHLYPSHEVTLIEPLLNDKGELTGYRVICELQRKAFEAKTVVLAAGALGTTKLLLKCKRNGTLPNLSDQLGKKFSANGDFQAGALQVSDELEPPRPHLGPVITSAIDFDNFVMEDGVVPGAVKGLWATIAGQMGELGHFRQLLKDFDFSRLALYGTTNMGKFSAHPDDTLMRSFMFLCSGRDGADGKIVLDEDGEDIDIKWNWENEQSQTLYRDMEDELRHLVKEGMGGAYFASPIWSLLGHLITVHPLGGCIMADNPQEGVVDSNGAAFNYPGLYVADGSIIPTALGVNPALTIAALSERIAQNVRIT